MNGIKTETNWQNYWGSSKPLLEDIQRLGYDNFTREIIHWCKTRELTCSLENDILRNNDVLKNILEMERVHFIIQTFLEKSLSTNRIL